MARANEQYAYFSMAGEFAPDELTRRLGVTPDSAWAKGELHPRSGAARRFSRWSLESRLDHESSLEAHIADVLARMDAHAEAFAAVSREHGGYMQLVGYFYSGYPGLHFDAAIVAGLARYGLAVDFDFYHLGRDGHGDE